MNKANARPSYRNEILIVLLLFGCYAYFFPRWADPNQNSRLDMVVAVVDDGTLMIDKYVENTVDYAKVGGHYYSDKPPGSAFLGIPVYAGLKAVLQTPMLARLVEKLSTNQAFQATLREGGSGVYLEKVHFAIAQVALTLAIPVMASILLALLLYRILLDYQIDRRVSLAAVLCVGLLTPVFAYAGEYYSHMVSAALLVLGFYLIRGNGNLGAGRLLLAGFCLGYAVLTEYSVILVACVLFVYSAIRLIRLRSWPRIIWMAISAGAVGAGLMLYNNAVFGGPLKLGYEYSELWTAQHSTGFMSLVAPTWDAIWGITFSPFRGLFFLSPILLFGLPGFYLWWRSGRFRAEFWTALAATLAMFLFNASSIMWWGGFAVGPRYFLPAVPFIGLAAAFAAQAWQAKPWFKVSALVLAAWSLMATWGLTIAGQSFPSDQILNPLLGYALPNWQAGNIARNYGTILGLKGLASLLPLGIYVCVLLGGNWLMARTSRRIHVGEKEITASY